MHQTADDVRPIVVSRTINLPLSDEMFVRSVGQQVCLSEHLSCRSRRRRAPITTVRPTVFRFDSMSSVVDVAPRSSNSRINVPNMHNTNNTIIDKHSSRHRGVRAACIFRLFIAYNSLSITRSQAVARIADRTTSQQTIYSSDAVSSNAATLTPFSKED